MSERVILYIFIITLMRLGITYGKVTRNVKIIGGVDTDISEVPYQVALESEGNQQYCGGVIISKKFVLTAAHCILGQDLKSVRTGSSLLEEGGKILLVKNAVVHPKYDDAAFDHDYDVGVIELSSSIEFGENSQPIALPQQEVVDGTVVKISGWGVLSNGGDSPKQLQSVEVPILERSKCGEYFALNITERMICGYEADRNACNGDSGGPVVFNKTVVGLVSWSSYRQCAEENHPGVYTNVADSQILSFIKNVTGL